MNKYLTAHSNDFGWGTNHPMPEYKVEELLPYVAGNNILDIGCGPGHLVNELSIRGFKAVGIDISPKFISFARKNYQGKFIVADALNLPFTDKQFETVFVRNTLEHLENDLKALKEALRVGNKVVVTVPLETDPQLRSRGLIFSHYQDASHLRYYTLDNLKALADQAKSKIVSNQSIEKVPVREVFMDIIRGPLFLRKIISRIIFTFLKPRDIYLEIVVVINTL